jgi:hypothetical protein
MTYERNPDWVDDVGVPSGFVGFSTETTVNMLGPGCAAAMLIPGMRLISRRGAVVLRSVEHRKAELVQLVRIKADAFGAGLPCEDVVLGADTRLRLSGKAALARALPDPSFISARMAVNGTTITQESAINATLVWLGFDLPNLVFASGLGVACQTGARG